MKRLQVLLLVALSSTFLMFGCGKEESTSKPSSQLFTEQQPEAQKQTPTAAQTIQDQDGDVPPAEGMVRSTLTNEWIDGELANARPIAVMIPNDSVALPHYNLSKADILYECGVEGGITRCMAIIKDWEDMERIGNVRSCRDYYVYWSFEWDSIYLHYGGPFYINTIIEKSDTDHITGSSYGDRRTDNLYDKAFFRSTDKRAPHNAYASAEGINAAIEKFGYSKTYREDYHDPNHFLFASSGQPNTLEQYGDSITAGEIDLQSAYPQTDTAFSYNPEDGLYYRSMYGKPHTDAANDNQQLSFKNVLIQFTYHEVRDNKGYLAFQVHDTTRDGYFFTNGRGIHVTWKKTADYEPTKYYDDNGNEIEINTGKTMICVLKEGDSFEVDGAVLKSKAN
ncbi:MAG: DUF3048 domain-containing protein [Lachnospiraceae bacterium]|nr:DUF3048 domain-containing protein [Lachnospiraceae bacterium]